MDLDAAFEGPGSFIEVKKIIHLLTESALDHPSFHGVAISLPGFGFSEAPRKKGFAGDQYTEVSGSLFFLSALNDIHTLERSNHTPVTACA